MGPGHHSLIVYGVSFASYEVYMHVLVRAGLYPVLCFHCLLLTESPVP